MRNNLYQHEKELATGATSLTSENDEHEVLLEVERQLQSREIECDIRSARVKEEEREQRELKAQQETTYAEQVRKVEELAAELRKERELLSREREEIAQLRQVREALLSNESGIEGKLLPSTTPIEDFQKSSAENVEDSAEIVGDSAVQEDAGRVEEEPLDATELENAELNNSELGDTELAETPEAAEPEIERRQPARSSSQPVDEDLSIEDYMAGLLNRMRGGAPAPAAVVAPEPKRNKRKSDPAPVEDEPKVSENAPAAVRVQQVVDMPMGLTELTRRSQPVHMISYAAMRELANNQARIAIDTHGKKELLKATLINSGLSVACFAGTLAIFTMMPGDVPGLRTGSMAIVIAGVYWLLEAIVAGRLLCADVAGEAKPVNGAEPNVVEANATAKRA